MGAAAFVEDAAEEGSEDEEDRAFIHDGGMQFESWAGSAR